MRRCPQRGFSRAICSTSARTPGRDWWPARGVRIGPFPRDLPPVPGQQGSRSHYPVQPEVSGQQPCQGSDHGTVSPVWFRAADVPAQDRDLVPEHEDLRVLNGIAPYQEHQPAEHPDHEQVDEADEHEPRA